ncbi:hypothetical protein COY52_01105 [Candidatus Desantisbacteria bacterium CG_4_10_14_0_8_um_filter_48_22]|uniref:Uncharacterized protein n=1 Tax=Candidatus Desantisbacteria bacterium CG_4_10_14_0_8_um_filter_48_22 TaxID=1974543 RepID=A0A2M7SF33_9BACT|nr:MAG: hypothetical protein COY52_01105 [Candidatus Desantisbacteria bacterium CG_4_10_14_0_8_um_filter_48_22]
MRNKKLGKISDKTDTRIPNAFDTGAYKTERATVAVLSHWMRNIIEERNFDLGMPDVDTSGADRKSPDIVIYETRKSQNVLCVIEAKLPYFDVFDEENLKRPAWEKANQRKAKYFAITNFKRLIWFNTEKVNFQKPEEEQVVEKYDLSEIEDINQIEQPRFSEPTKKGLEAFLLRLYSVHLGKEPEPKQAIDEFLIYRLQEKINRLSKYYRVIIDDQCHKNPKFSKEIQKWFIKQGWSFAWQSQDFDKVARQTAYLLVNKILFYDLLQAKRPGELSLLEIPKGLLKGSQLHMILQSYFDQVLKIDYETIYTTDFIDSIAFPDEKEVIEEIKELINILRQYDFSKIGYDIIGRIFEHLIPSEERHNLGQYFTNPDVVDLILKFCLNHEDDKVLDPACGAGTFLVRAYQHKKIMNQYQKHEDILDSLWGCDIAKFPAHLATINLAINDLKVDKNYPNILPRDFFTLLVGDEGFDPKEWRVARSKTLRVEEREVVYPRWFNAIVGNPPYTRQEEISEIAPDDKEYKENTIDKALYFHNQKIADISKRAGIHAYFFVHGTKFLKDGGFFGFVVSNSWLDVEYGKGLQELFLRNYKIIAIIESKVERWFEEADINTCIVIMQRCKDEKERNENLARFVYLKKPLRYFIPPAKDMWEKQVERLGAIDNLKKTILAHNDFYENEDLRIFPKNQKELWEEGFELEENKYIGSKWGKYLHADEIFFKILLKGKDKFVPLKKIADIRRGFTTGANEFFFLTEEEIKKKGIEKEFWMHKDDKDKWVPNYVIKSPRECKSIVVKPRELKYRILIIERDKKELKNTKILKYIKYGESRGYHRGQTCANRGDLWYNLGKRTPASININYLINDVARAFVGKFWVSDDFQEIHAPVDVAPLLNSTLFWFMQNIFGRTSFGGGLLKIQTYEFKQIPICYDSRFSKKLMEKFYMLCDRPVESIFSELGTSSLEGVSLDKIKPDRRELDKIIMGEILGLTDEEQLEVYRAVVDLVKSRIEKAKSFGKKKKTKEGIDINMLIKTVMEKIGEETLGKFYCEKVLSESSFSAKNLPKSVEPNEIEISPELDGSYRLYYKKGKCILCSCEDEAKYVAVFLKTGIEKVKIPKDKKYLHKILPEFESLYKKIDAIIQSYLDSILDTKLRARLFHQLWQEIMK